MDSSQHVSGKNWKPLSITHVEYHAGDLLGFLMAWFTLLPIIYIFCLVTAIALRRDLLTIFYFLGLFLNEAINYVLKNIIKEPRPMSRSKEGAVKNVGTFTKHGMPSDHAQTICYFMSFICLVVVFRVYLHSNKLVNTATKTLFALLTAFISFMVSYSRIYLEYHTSKQVLVGALVGTVFGLVWFYFVHFKLSPYFHFICSWRISEFLMLRDYTNIPNILVFQYTCERNEAKIRRKVNAN